MDFQERDHYNLHKLFQSVGGKWIVDISSLKLELPWYSGWDMFRKEKESQSHLWQLLQHPKTMPNQISIYKTNIEDQIEFIFSLKEKLLNVTFYKEKIKNGKNLHI